MDFFETEQSWSTTTSVLTQKRHNERFCGFKLISYPDLLWTKPKPASSIQRDLGTILALNGSRPIQGFQAKFKKVVEQRLGHQFKTGIFVVTDSFLGPSKFNFCENCPHLTRTLYSASVITEIDTLYIT